MKFYFTLFLFFFLIQEDVFSQILQNNSTENVVLLSFDAYANKKDAANSDTLKIGDDVKNSVFVQKGGYLCLMNEKGYLVEYRADKEDKKYKIKYPKMDDSIKNLVEVRKNIGNLWININTKQKRPTYLHLKTGKRGCPTYLGINILAESKTETLFDTTIIFIDYYDYKSTYEYNHRYDDEDTIFIPKNIRVEVADLRNNLLYKSSLDSNFFIFTWDLINKDSSDNNNIALYQFFAQDNKGKELKSGASVLSKKRKKLNSYEEYLISDSNISFDNFLKAILASNDNGVIYFPAFYTKFMKELPKNAYQTVPNTIYDFAVYFGFQIR